MKIFILANGEAVRWQNYQGAPKHLIKINGETLIDRMVRLLKENGQTDIVIVGSYKIDGCTNYINKADNKIDLFIELARLAQDTFVMLNGDCYYTDAIIKDCCERQVDVWGHWENPYSNAQTGKPYGEGFIHKVVDIYWWLDKLTNLRSAVDHGCIDLSCGNDWIINEYLYDRGALYQGIHSPCEPYDIVWDDETDDFDFPDDLDRFIEYTGYTNG